MFDQSSPGPLLAAFSADYQTQLKSGNLDLNAGETAWLDTFTVQVRHEPDLLTVDSLRVNAQGIRLDAAGSMGTTMDFNGHVSIPDLKVLQQWVPVPEDLTGHTSGTFSLRGSSKIPRASAELTGAVSLPAVSVPRWNLFLASGDDGSHSLVLNIPGWRFNIRSYFGLVVHKDSGAGPGPGTVAH